MSGSINLSTIPTTYEPVPNTISSSSLEALVLFGYVTTETISGTVNWRSTGKTGTVSTGGSSGSGGSSSGGGSSGGENAIDSDTVGGVALSTVLSNLLNITTGGTLAAPINWEYNFTNKPAEKFTYNIITVDNHNNNAITAGGNYIPVDGVDSHTTAQLTINGTPSNGWWANAENLYLNGAGDGISNYNTHVSRYITAYRTNTLYQTTVITSATPTVPVTTITVANTLGFGQGFPSGGGATAVCAGIFAAASASTSEGETNSNTYLTLLLLTLAETAVIQTGMAANGPGIPANTTVVYVNAISPAASGNYSATSNTNTAISITVPSGAVVLSSPSVASIAATSYVTFSYPLSIVGQSGTFYEVINAVGTSIDPVLGATGPGTLTLATAMSVQDATTNAVIANGLNSSNIPSTMMRGAAMLPFVIEGRDKSGYGSGIAGAIELIEIDLEAVDTDIISQRKAMGIFFNLCTNPVFATSAANSGATTIYISVPTWYSYYPGMSIPRIGFYLFGSAFAANTRINSVVSTGLSSGTFGQDFVFETYTIQLNQATIAALSASQGFTMSPANAAYFNNEKQISIPSNCFVNIAQQYYGGGSITGALIDTTQILEANGARMIRLGDSQSFAWGNETDSNQVIIKHGGSTGSGAGILQFTQFGLQSFLAPGLNHRYGFLLTGAATLTKTEIGCTMVLQSTSTFTVTLPSSMTIPNGLGFGIYNNSAVRHLVNTPSDAITIPGFTTANMDLLPGDFVWMTSNNGGLYLPLIRSNTNRNGPYLSTAQLQVMQVGMQTSSINAEAFASDGRNPGEVAGAGTGCPVFLKLTNGTSGNPIWAANWSGVAVTN